MKGEINMTIKLGDKVKDPISGFTGTAVGITKYLWGCTSIGVCTNVLKDGKPIEWQWFDENRLTKDIKSKITGGPNDSSEYAPER